jgi:hypothetical protein
VAGRVRSSPISEAELVAAACDYIALGHVHLFQDCTPKVKFTGLT